MVYIRLTTFQVDKINASWPKIDFYDFCLYNDFAKQGVTRSCGKATNFRAQIFLGRYWAHGSTFKRSLLIIGEKFFFEPPYCTLYTVQCTLCFICPWGYNRLSKTINTTDWEGTHNVCTAHTGWVLQSSGDSVTNVPSLFNSDASGLGE